MRAQKNRFSRAPARPLIHVASEPFRRFVRKTFCNLIFITTLLLPSDSRLLQMFLTSLLIISNPVFIILASCRLSHALCASDPGVIVKTTNYLLYHL